MKLFSNTSRLILIAAVSISSLVQARPLDPITPSEQDARLVELQHEAWTGKSVLASDGWHGSCRRSAVTLEIPWDGGSRSQKYVIVRPDVSHRVPVMLLVPTIESITMVEKSVATNFCDLEVATIIADVNDPTVPSEMPSWGFEDRNNMYAIRALRTILDYAERSPGFDPDRMGIMGLSLGAVTTGFMAGVEADRLKAVVTVVGAGNISQIMAESDHDKVARLRKRRMKFEGYTTVEEYESKLREVVRYDSLYFASRAKTDNIFMVLSNHDTTVPSATQVELFEAFGKPRNKVFSTDHAETVLALTYFYFDYVSDFLIEKFRLDPALKLRNAHRFLERGVSVPPVTIGEIPTH